MLALVVVVSGSIVVLECLYADNFGIARLVLVTKEGYRLIRFPLKVAKANDVATHLYRIEYTICPRKCLYEPMMFKILVEPKCV